MHITDEQKAAARERLHRTRLKESRVRGEEEGWKWLIHSAEHRDVGWFLDQWEFMTTSSDAGRVGWSGLMERPDEEVEDVIKEFSVLIHQERLDAEFFWEGFAESVYTAHGEIENS